MYGYFSMSEPKLIYTLNDFLYLNNSDPNLKRVFNQSLTLNTVFCSWKPEQVFTLPPNTVLSSVYVMHKRTQSNYYIKGIIFEEKRCNSRSFLFKNVTCNTNKPVIIQKYYHSVFKINVNSCLLHAGTATKLVKAISSSRHPSPQVATLVA